MWVRMTGREEAAQSERRERSETDQKFREIKVDRWGKEAGKNDGKGEVGATGSRERGALLHISANYNS